MHSNNCFIAGYPIKRYKFKYNEDYSLCKKIKKALRQQIMLVFDEKQVRNFYVGTSIGLDTWAAEILIELKEQPQYMDIQIILVNPFPNPDSKYDERQQRRYRYIAKCSNESNTICSRYTPDAYKRSYYHMVDQCSYGILVFDNDFSERSVIGQTVNYAGKKQTLLILIDPDSGAILSEPES